MKAVLRAIGDDASATASRGSRLERAGISPASTRSSGAAMASAAGAEDAPVAPELLTPPLGLVALLGRSDLHPAVREALRTEARPPLECLSGGELADASRVLVARKRSRPPADPLAAAAALAAANPAAPSAGDAPGSVPGFVPAPAPSAGPPVGFPPVGTAEPPTRAPVADALHPGCLKAGWLVKHRRHRPALALVFLDREDVEGDPNRWISLSAALDAARAAAEAADCKLAVVVVDEAAETRGVIPDDRCDAVRRRLKIDPRALMTMSLPPTPDAVKALASLCKALCAEHYAKEASLRASRTHVEDDALGSVANPAFKAGAFSEFRGDWAGAARWYARAHQALVAAHGDERRAPKPPANESNQSNAPIDAFRVQRRRAALLAAANASYKTCALSLMLDPDAPRDAVAHFQAHAAAFKKPPTWLPREYLPEHHAWLASQYAAFGRLLASRVAWGGDADPASGRPFAPPPAGTPRTYLPGFYFHAAANAVEARRRSLEAAMDASEATTSASAAATPAVVLRPGPREGTLVNAATGAPVPDAAFLRHTLSNAKETFAALPAARVRLLAEAREHYKRALAFDETPKHARLFASLASQLASATLAAGDVAAAERLFEAAAAVYRREGWDDLLGVTLMALKECYRRVPDARKKRAHLETCLELAALGAGNGAVLASGHGAFDPDAAAHAARAAMTETGAAVDDNVVAVGGDAREGARANGVDRAFRCVAGFRTNRAVPGERTRFTAALKWALPFEVKVASVAVEFSDPLYAWRRAAGEDDSCKLDTSSDVPAALKPKAWHRVATDVTPKWGHPVRATAVVVTLETGIAFRAALKSGPERDGPPREEKENDSENTLDRLPDFMTDVRVGVHALDLRGAAPRVSLEARLAGPALLGENCALPLAVVSTGDAMDAAALSFRTKRRGDGGTVSSDAETVEVTFGDGGDEAQPLGPDDVVPVGRVAPGQDWRGVVYVRRRTLGPPVTLVVELRGAQNSAAGRDTAGPAGEASPAAPPGARPSPELETEVEVAVHAPFEATRETTAAYRTHALSFEGADGETEATRLMTRLRVGAAGSRLRVAGADAFGRRSATCFFPVALDEGDEFLHVAESTRGAPAPELSVSWRRAESDELSRDARTVIPSTNPSGLGEIGDTGAFSLPGELSAKTAASSSVTVTLTAPPRVRVGVPFSMRVCCSNATAQAQPLRVRVADANGFVFSGSRDFSVTAAPRGEAETAYTLVALRSGEAALPEVEVTAVRLGAALRPPQVARAIYVEP